MKIGNLLFSAVQFFIIVGMICWGAFFVALPFVPHVRYECARIFTDRPEIFTAIGSVVLVIGLILAIGFYFLQKKAYFQVQMSPSVAIEKEVIQGVLTNYWKSRFPQDKLKTDVIFHRDQKVELVAELPFLGEGEVSKHLSEIEEEVGRLLVQQLGYQKEFLFTFQLK